MGDDSHEERDGEGIRSDLKVRWIMFNNVFTRDLRLGSYLDHIG